MLCLGDLLVTQLQQSDSTYCLYLWYGNTEEELEFPVVLCSWGKITGSKALGIYLKKKKTTLFGVV